MGSGYLPPFARPFFEVGSRREARIFVTSRTHRLCRARLANCHICMEYARILGVLEATP